MTRVWFNGALIDGPLPLDPRDRGLLLGDGIFETILVAEGQPVWLGRHLARMREAASELGIGFDEGRIAGAVAAVLGPIETASLRLTLTRGVSLGGDSNLLVTLTAIDKETQFQPVRLVTSPIRRNETAPSSRFKTLSYADSIAAARDATDRRADDALMLNTAGFVASTAIANIFLLQSGTLVTPSLGQGILPGITRSMVLGLAPSLGLGASERPVGPNELPAADAVFITNSLRLVRPVTVLDGRPLEQNSSSAVRAIFDALRN